MSMYQKTMIPSLAWDENLPKPAAKSAEELLINQTFLAQKLGKITRETTNLDLLKITKAISTPEEYYAAINSLLPGSSFIIQQDIQIGTEKMFAGDFVLKTFDNKINLIKATSAAIFYPYQYLAESKQLFYAFSAEKPKAVQESEIPDISVNPITKPVEKMKITLNDPANNTVYNISQLYEGPIVFKSITNIIPVVKTFLKTGENQYEELYGSFDLRRSADNTQWTFTITGVSSQSNVWVVIK